LRRNGLIVLAVAAVAWGIVAILLATGALSGGHRTLAPACLPGGLDRSAALPGTSVDVSPAPDSVAANPRTQISFLGAPASELRDVSVTGSRSGRHAGRLAAYSQGDGGSFVPSRPFEAGERVSVRAVIGDGATASGTDANGTGASGASAIGTGAAAGGRRVAFSFRVDTPYPTNKVPPFPNPQASPAEYQSFRTQPGMQAPTLTVTTPDRDPAAGDILTTNGPGPGRYGALIYSPQGRLVWFHQLSGGLAAEDLNVQSYEGKQDLTFWQGRVLSLGYGDGEDVVLSSRYQTVAKVHGGNGLMADLHELQIAPDRVAWITAYNPIRCNLSSVEKGPQDGAILDGAVQAIDIRTGLVRWEWHSLDHVGVTESQNSPPAKQPWDWFHINSIDPQRNGDVFVSARNTWAGYQIEGGGGRVLWRLGGSRSSFKMGPGTSTAWQHDGRILPDGEVTFFDDGANWVVHSQSRAVRIRLDFTTHEARLTSSLTHPGGALLAASQGNAQTLPSGNVLVGWGGVPQISELDSGGRLLFDAHMPLDMVYYRAYRHPWSGRPATPPTVLSNLNNTSEETIVHMSWNGATEVAAWRVLAGSSPSSLQARVTVSATGFETSAILPKRYAYAAVQALDSAGRAIGTSQTAKVSGYAASFATGG
jgi:hypothetical protein